MTFDPHVSPNLPDGVRQRSLPGANGLDVNNLAAGYETPARPAVLLLHVFPDIAYSWRKTMLPLAAAGYHVIAPDQRSHGGTTGWDDRYDGDLASFRTHDFPRDALGVAEALGHRSVEAVVGHDLGSMIAADCALVRPDVFRSLVVVSFRFDGPPAPSLDERLAALPHPRQDSMAWFGTPGANADMLHAPQGRHRFLRAYFHVKSADGSGNHPHPLAGGDAAEIATLRRYYIMDRGVGMAETVAPDMPSPAEVAANRWLPEPELAFYAAAFGGTGFLGGLNWFRCHTGGIGRSEIEFFAGRAIDVPSRFISGTADWGTYRKPGAVDRMRTETCTRMQGVPLIAGAGHWCSRSSRSASTPSCSSFSGAARSENDERRAEPPREAYHAVAQALAVEPSNLWFDSCHAFDVMEAATAGLRSAPILRPGNAPFGLGPQPDTIISDIPELARALAERAI